MALLTIRDPVSGKVIINESSFVSRHLATLEVNFKDTGTKTVSVPGLSTGTPYYLVDCNSIFHEAGIMDERTNALGYGVGINVRFSGEAVIYNVYYTAGSLSTVDYLSRTSNKVMYLHLGVF